MKLITYLCLVPRLRMHPLPKYFFIAWCLVKYRDDIICTEYIKYKYLWRGSIYWFRIIAKDKHEDVLLSLQKPGVGPYPALVQSSLILTSVSFFKIHFHLIFQVASFHEGFSSCSWPFLTLLI